MYNTENEQGQANGIELHFVVKSFVECDDEMSAELRSTIVMRNGMLPASLRLLCYISPVTSCWTLKSHIIILFLISSRCLLVSWTMVISCHRMQASYSL